MGINFNNVMVNKILQYNILYRVIGTFRAHGVAWKDVLKVAYISIMFTVIKYYKIMKMCVLEYKVYNIGASQASFSVLQNLHNISCNILLYSLLS